MIYRQSHNYSAKLTIHFFAVGLTNKQLTCSTVILPESPNISYNLRDRSHNRNLLAKSASLSDRDFIIRMLYNDCY